MRIVTDEVGATYVPFNEINNGDVFSWHPDADETDGGPCMKCSDEASEDGFVELNSGDYWEPNDSSHLVRVIDAELRIGK